MKQIIQFIKDFFNRGEERSVKAKKNIVFSFGLKIISVLVSFALVPLSLHYLGIEEYGIWLTLSSILGWLGYFDIGLGNGLRNKLTECLVKKNFELGRIYVSTTYASVILIFVGILIVFLSVNPFLYWVKIINTSESLSNELNNLVFVVVFFLIIRFILELISTIVIADQNPSISSLFDVIANIISLFILILLKYLNIRSLLYLGLAFSAAPVIVYIVSSIYYFKGKYYNIRPSLKYVDFKYFKELGGLGIKFLFIQLAFLIIFSMNNFIISYLFGPSKVTPYNIAYKYFANAYMVYVIILYPYWSAFTDAYVQNDFNWIRNTLEKLKKLWALMCVGIIVMMVFSNLFYKIWVGPTVKISISVSILMGIFIAIFAWFNTFCFFINGTGKITLQLLVYIIAALINIPLIVFFGKYLNLGLCGVLIANIISMLPIAIYMPVQTYKIINGKAKGIWIK
jgi:O-antigen/teichoic acid export membrane protein